MEVRKKKKTFDTTLEILGFLFYCVFEKSVCKTLGLLFYTMKTLKLLLRNNKKA